MKRPSGTRITGGALRGRAVAVPRGDRVRPMRSRIREALFQMLGPEIRGARFLDVFSGSGAIGFEALSRGAGQAVLLETDAEVLSVLERNRRELGLIRRSEIWSHDAYGEQLPPGPFDFVFLDPPFPDFDSPGDSDDPGPQPWDLAARLAVELLTPGGVLGLEYPRYVHAPEPPAGVRERTQKRYGDTRLVLWEADESAGE